MQTRKRFHSPRSDASFIEVLESRIAPAGGAFPSVISIDRLTPAEVDTAAASVVYKVTFDQAVTGVDKTDFEVFTSGDAKANATVSVPTTSDNIVFNVTITGLQGNGDVRLDLVDDDSIMAGGKSLGGTNPATPSTPAQPPNGSFTGETYHLLQTHPKVESIDANGANPTGSSTVSWTVTFSEGVTGVDTTDFALVYTAPTTGPATPATVTPITVTNGAGYTVTANGIMGAGGTVGLNLLDDGTSLSTIKDTDNNPLQTNPISFADGVTYVTGDVPAAIASGDLDGDGNADLVTANFASSNVSVMLGNGNGTMGMQTVYDAGSIPRSVVVADVNGDGRPDILASELNDTRVAVLLGNGDGTFQPKLDFVPGNDHLAVAVGDLNNDGQPDIVATGHNFGGTGTVSVLLGTGNNSFGPQQTFDVGLGPYAVAIGDVNGDGKADVVTANYNSNNVSVLLGDGTGTLGTATNFGTGGAPVAVALGDVNGDGRPDLVTANYTGTSVSVLLGDGLGMFATKVDYSTPTGTTPSGVALTDVNGDGILDMVVSSGVFEGAEGSNERARRDLPTSLVFVLPGNADANGKADGTFGTPLPFDTKGLDAAGLVIADFNGDGKPDIATPNASTNNASVLLNNGKGPFTGETFTIAPPSVDPAITSISDGMASAMTGDLLTYSIGYKNNGTTGATGVTLMVPLDSHLFFVASENPGWSESGGTLTKTFPGTLGAGATGTDPLKLHVKQVVLNSHSSATTTVTISADGSDSDPTNNSGANNDPLTGQVYSGFVVTAPGISPKLNKFGLPVVRVFDRLSGADIYQFSAYEETYRDSIRVALGDFNRDGVDDIVTTTQHAGGRMRFFDGATGMQFTSGPLSEEIPVFGENTKQNKNKGAFVAVGNVNGEGLPEIVVGSSLISAGVGGGTVIVYSLDPPPSISPGTETLSIIKEFTPFGPKFKGGVRVAVGDVDYFSISERLEDDIIVGQGFHGATVKAYKGLALLGTNNDAMGDVPSALLGAFKVGAKNFKGGVSVGAADIDRDGHADIIVGRNTGKPSVFEVFDGESLLEFPPGGVPTQIGPTVVPFDLDPQHPKNTSGVRVAAADVNDDGYVDIIASVGIKKNSLVQFYDGKDFLLNGTMTPIEGRTLTAFEGFLDVALWVAGSRFDSRQ